VNAVNQRARQPGAALVEFALVWPIALLLVLGTVETAVWSAEAYAVRAASLAGARAGSVAGGSAATASAVAVHALAAGLVGVDAVAWCPGARRPAPPLWVCAFDLGPAVEVDVGGSVPALVPIVPGGGLPVHAHVVIQKERFAG
jgi:TadE-like protein